MSNICHYDVVQNWYWTVVPHIAVRESMSIYTMHVCRGHPMLGSCMVPEKKKKYRWYSTDCLLNCSFHFSICFPLQVIIMFHQSPSIFIFLRMFVNLWCLIFRIHFFMLFLSPSWGIASHWLWVLIKTSLDSIAVF